MHFLWEPEETNTLSHSIRALIVGPIPISEKSKYERKLHVMSEQLQNISKKKKMVFDDTIVGMLKKEEKHRKKKNPEVNKKQNIRFFMVC